ADERPRQKQRSNFVATRATRRLEHLAFRNLQRALSAMTALCLFGGKELLSGNTVRAVAHPAPQRQLERSQAAQLAFGSLDRGLDEFLGNGAPICKHDDAIHPYCPEALSCGRNRTNLDAAGAWMTCEYL